VNTFGEPTRWKARSTVSWRQAGFTVTLTGNYVSNYEDDLFTPEQPIASWTTGDVFLSYTTGVTPVQYWLQKLTIFIQRSELYEQGASPSWQYQQHCQAKLPIPYDPAKRVPGRGACWRCKWSSAGRVDTFACD